MNAPQWILLTWWMLAVIFPLVRPDRTKPQLVRWSEWVGQVTFKALTLGLLVWGGYFG